jgi:hypothetical protein
MGEVFECSSKSTKEDCSHALLASAQGRPHLNRVQSDGDAGDGYGKQLPGGVTLQDLVWRYIPGKLEIEQGDWEPQHKAWEQKTADFIKQNPNKFSEFNDHGFMSKVADAAFDLGTKKLFDIFLEDVNKNLKGAYKLSLRPDPELLAQSNAMALVSRGDQLDFAGYLDLKDKSGKVLGSIQIRHTPIPGTLITV